MNGFIKYTLYYLGISVLSGVMHCSDRKTLGTFLLGFLWPIGVIVIFLVLIYLLSRPFCGEMVYVPEDDD